MSKNINLNTLYAIAEALREVRQEKKKEEQKSVHAMLDGADIFSRDFFVKKGSEGGKKSAPTASERAKRGWKTRRKLSTPTLDD